MVQILKQPGPSKEIETAGLQEVFAEAVKLNRQITKFLKFSTYTDYNDLNGLDGIDHIDGKQLLLWEGPRLITDKLADAQARIADLTRPIVETCRLRKGISGKYQTTK